MSTNQASEWQHVERPTTSFGSFPLSPALARAGIAPTCGSFLDYVMALVMGLIGSSLLLFCIFHICEADFELLKLASFNLFIMGKFHARLYKTDRARDFDHEQV
jgi:hypothetical protein